MKEFHLQMDKKFSLMNDLLVDLTEKKNKRKREENLKKPKSKEKEKEKIKDEKKIKRRKKDVKNVIFEGLEDAEAQFFEIISEVRI
jgi:hypothetical protein